MENNPVIYINKKYPIIFIQKNLANITLSTDELEVVFFSQVDEEGYSLEPNLLEKWSKGRSITGGLQANSLSVSDIWWATVI